MATPKELIDAVVANRRLPHTFSDDEIQQAEQSARAPVDESRRLDLRGETLVTIDDADARDFDDAVGARALPHGKILITVAIADVAAFVPTGSALDAAARLRGNSVYLPDRVLPMLPPALSNDRCSLQPQQDRACLCCQMEWDRRAKGGGAVSRYRFSRGMMRSARRLTYEEATDLIERGEGEGDEVATALQTLASVSHSRRGQRRAAGAMVLTTPGKKCWIDDDGDIRTRLINHNIARDMIEEMMLLANQSAADFLIRRRRRVLHRVHPKPPAENLAKLRLILAPFKIGIPPAQKLRAADFAEAIEAIRARDEGLGEAMLPAVLGALSRAQYAPDEETGHFGLACAHYLHFTSPIRRYPDLLTHRAIVAALEADNPLCTAADKSLYATAEGLAALGEHCSQTEVQADKSEWDCYQALMCARAVAFVGSVYRGFVSGVVKFGVFVTLPDLDADGVARFKSMRGFWKFDEGAMAATCDDGGRLGLGDAVTARVTAVNPDRGQIDIVLLDD